jgi:hypothetical protein
MAATTPHHHRPARRLQAVAGLFWFLLTTLLAMTASLLLIGGDQIVRSSEVRLVLVAGVVLFAVHTAGQYRHRNEPVTDERLLRARERRGF